MKIDVDILSPTQRKIRVEVPGADVDQEFVRAYDTLVQTFPSLVIARMFGFTARPYFELDPIVRDSGPPPVDLSHRT